MAFVSEETACPWLDKMQVGRIYTCVGSLYGLLLIMLLYGLTYSACYATKGNGRYLCSVPFTPPPALSLKKLAGRIPHPAPTFTQVHYFTTSDATRLPTNRTGGLFLLGRCFKSASRLTEATSTLPRRRQSYWFEFLTCCYDRLTFTFDFTPNPPHSQT